MKSAVTLYQVISGPYMKVICIGQFNLTSYVFKILGRNRTLDGTYSSDIHKKRGLDRAMHGHQFTPSCFSVFF